MDDAPHAVSERRVEIDVDPLRAHTLPGWVYLDADIHQRERTAIFMRSWQYAGAAHELRNSGDYVTARLLDQNVLIMRGRDGELRGFHNVCRHRAHELLEGRGNTRVITCPYHAWSYHDDGTLRTARGAEGQPAFEAGGFCLKSVRVEVFARKFVFFNLDPDATPMSAVAGDLAAALAADIPEFDRLVPAEPSAPSRMVANWKVVVDNFLECYHCGPAHPAFTDLLDMTCYRTITHGIWSHQVGDVVRAQNKAYPVDPAARAQSARFWFLWPNITFATMPGAANMSISMMLPDGLDGTTRRFQRFELPGAERDAARAAYSRDVLGPEDVAICESVQRGLRSLGYDSGRFVIDPSGGQNTEAAVHHFHRLYVAAMGLE